MRHTCGEPNETELGRRCSRFCLPLIFQASLPTLGRPSTDPKHRAKMAAKKKEVERKEKADADKAAYVIYYQRMR